MLFNSSITNDIGASLAFLVGGGGVAGKRSTWKRYENLTLLHPIGTFEHKMMLVSFVIAMETKPVSVVIAMETNPQKN